MPEETLRETLEAAYEEVGTEPASTPPEETRRPAEDASEPVRNTAPTEESTAAEPAADSSGGRKRGSDGKFLKKADEAPAAETLAEPVATNTEVKPEETAPEPRPSIRAPESWKPNAREHWAKLPPDVQQEVSRREREITQTLQQTADDRKLANHFKEGIRPFEAMIRAEGRDPVVAASELFATAHLLRAGTPAQKATLVANMVKNFAIPIDLLDSALVGEQIPDEDTKLQKLLDQRLAPVTQFISEVQSLKKKRQETTGTEVMSEIQAFAEKPENEFFDDVREEMADLMEIASKRGNPMTLEQAYKKAVAMNEDVQKVLETRKQAKVNSKLAASSSLPSTPPPSGGASGKPGTLRDDIENAFSSVANR